MPGTIPQVIEILCKKFKDKPYLSDCYMGVITAKNLDSVERQFSEDMKELEFKRAEGVVTEEQFREKLDKMKADMDQVYQLYDSLRQRQ